MRAGVLIRRPTQTPYNSDQPSFSEVAEIAAG
jgi:hypothetical protein